jgi:hypothetical protein
MKAQWWVLLVVLLLTQGVQLMAARVDRPVINASSAIATLEVFSGRPDPTWTLSGQQTAELSRRLQALELSTAKTVEFDGLGYRAIRAELQVAAKGTAVLTAARGAVTLDDAGERYQYADVELWLVNTGAGHVPPDVLRYVTSEIAGKSQ